MTLMNIGRAHRDEGNPEKAMATLGQAEKLLRPGQGLATEALPEYGGLLLLKADLLREAKRFSEAEAAAKEALEVLENSFEGEANPETAVALNGLGSIYHDQSQ